jgi:hypothetical protein
MAVREPPVHMETVGVQVPAFGVHPLMLPPKTPQSRIGRSGNASGISRRRFFVRLRFSLVHRDATSGRWGTEMKRIVHTDIPPFDSPNGEAPNGVLDRSPRPPSAGPCHGVGGPSSSGASNPLRRLLMYQQGRPTPPLPGDRPKP